MHSKLLFLGLIFSLTSFAQTKNEDPLDAKILEIEDPIAAQIKKKEAEKKPFSNYAEIVDALAPNLTYIGNSDLGKSYKSMKEAAGKSPDSVRRQQILKEIIEDRLKKGLPSVTPYEALKLVDEEMDKRAFNDCKKIQSEFIVCPEGTYTFSGSRLPSGIYDSLNRSSKEVIVPKNKDDKKIKSASEQ